MVVDELCVGDDTSGVGSASVPINEENGARQANTVACCVVASARIDRIGNSWESGELYFYICRMEQGNNGTNTWEHADRTSSLAGITTGVGIPVLESALNFAYYFCFAKIS